MMMMIELQQPPFGIIIEDVCISTINEMRTHFVCVLGEKSGRRKKIHETKQKKNKIIIKLSHFNNLSSQ